MNELQPLQAPWLGRSLSRRLVVAALLMSLATSLLVIAFQVWRAWSAGIESAEHRLDEIGDSIVPTLTASVWQVDHDRVNLLLDGLKLLPRVSYVDLTTRDGERFQRGDAEAAILVERSWDLHYVAANDYPLGTLRIVLGRQVLVQELTGAAITISVVTLVTLAASALLTLLLFRRRVTRHLTAMAEYARALRFDRLADPLVLPGKVARVPPDELDLLATSFNRMRATLRNELMLRELDRAELLEHREHLETMVHARTAELAEKNELLQQQKDEMQRLANTDSLTGVNSRRHFVELAERELARCERTGEPLSLLLLDIDHFKRINDRYGHDVGDLAIIHFCVVCSRQLHQVDVIGRIGGEEFAVLLPSTEVDNASLVAERVRAALSAAGVDTPRERISFTVSIGIAVRRGSGDSVAAMVKRADEALYQAKQQGRDRVCVSVAEPRSV